LATRQLKESTATEISVLSLTGRKWTWSQSRQNWINRDMHRH